MDPRIVKRLDAYWSKALELARERAQDTNVVERIFRNLLAVSSDDVALWWTKLSSEGKKRYLAKYPGSKYAKKVRAARKRKTKTPEDTKLLSGLEAPTKTQEPHVANVPDDEVEPDDAVESEEPDDAVESEEPVKRSLADRLSDAWAKKRTGVVDTLQHHKEGLHNVKSVLNGDKVDDDAFESARRTASTAALLILGAFAAVAILAGFAAFVGPLGALFLEDGSGNSMSSQSSTDPELAEDIADRMYEWMLSQDPDELKKRLENYSEK